MISGNMSVLSFDREEMGIHADCPADFAKVIDGGLKPFKIKHHKNAIQTAWLNNVAGALINKDYQWSTASAPQLGFEGYTIGPSTSADQNNRNGIGEFASTLDPPQTTIAIKDSNAKYGLLGADGSCDSPTTSSIHFDAFWFGDEVTVNEFYWGTLQTFVRAGAGTIVWRQLMAAVTGQSTAMEYDEVTKVNWTMNFAG